MLNFKENTVSYFKDLTVAGEKGKENKDETNMSSLSTGERVNGTIMSSYGHHLLHIWVVLCTFQKFYFLNAVK